MSMFPTARTSSSSRSCVLRLWPRFSEVHTDGRSVLQWGKMVFPGTSSQCSTPLDPRADMMSVQGRFESSELSWLAAISFRPDTTPQLRKSVSDWDGSSWV